MRRLKQVGERFQFRARVLESLLDVLAALERFRQLTFVKFARFDEFRLQLFGLTPCHEHLVLYLTDSGLEVFAFGSQRKDVF